jgi:hypothetical protein
VPQSQGSLLQFEMAQIFQNDVGHRHAKGRGKILLRHCLLAGRVSKEANQASGQILSVAGFVKLNRHPLAIGHLAKILKVRAHDRNSVGTGQVRDTAATRGRRVRHDRDGRVLEKIGQSILMHVAGEFDFRVCRALVFHRLHIARGVRMVPSSNHQPGVGQGFRHILESLSHQLQALVGSPFAEGQNAVFRISPPG